MFFISIICLFTWLIPSLGLDNNIKIHETEISMAENGDRTSNPRVIMWCVPRSVSTAFTKCMSFVDGAEVWLEPYVMSNTIPKIFDIFHDGDGEKLPTEVTGNEELYRELAEKLTLGGNIDEYNLDRLS